MDHQHLFLSAIGSDSVSVAEQQGLGLEITAFSMNDNLDRFFPETDREIRKQLRNISRCTLHAPYSELFPCAVDTRARELAAFRYRQSLDTALSYGAQKVIIHGGYVPTQYFPCWFETESVKFWQSFMETVPEGPVICLENVLETDPAWLVRIVKAVDHPQLRLCLDVGHCNAYAREFTPEQWLTAFAPYLSHLHIHNNMGDKDAHNALPDGSIPMASLLKLAGKLCPDAT